ncbi:MAG: hypothetical protein ACD_64C00320G0002 [uncultured bacterium]|nr:MAG: hypothetical protein ACD_64C00320G0002 [uncultured bacterium]
MRYITRKSCYISILLLIGVVLPLDAIRRRRYSSQKEVVSELKLMSSAFSHNGAIPRLYACDGEDMSPPLRWDGVPKGTKSFAIICNDPDSRGGLWVHWLVFNLPATVRYLPAHANIAYYKGVEGLNAWGTNDWGGPCPPVRRHRYTFDLYALSDRLRLTKKATRADLMRAMQGKILGKSRLIGTYQRARQ